MKCVIPSQNVKIIARAVHSLAKVGDEIFIQPAEDELLFRTINSAKSAFAEFRMCRSFFSSFNFSSPQDNDLECKITMKSCINVFRSVHGMEKQIENCEIRIKPQTTQVVFQIKFIKSSIKKYYLPVIENDQLEAQIPIDQPNQICATSKFLSASLKNFRHAEDEITITVDKDAMVIKNHLELKRDLRLMRTELCYHQTEFESYVVENPTKVTFCIKELRAVVAFAEPANLPVILSFKEPGRPVVFQIMNHPAYEANYVISTLPSNRPDRSSHQSSCQNIDSVTTPISQGIKRNSKSSTPYSFVEKESTTPSISKKKRNNIRGDVSFTSETMPNTSYQANIEKSVQQFLSKPDPVKEMEKEIGPSKVSLEIGSLHNTSPKLVSNDDNVPFLNECPSTSQVVPESEPAVSITHESLQSRSLEPGPSEANLTIFNAGPSTSQVAPESLHGVNNKHKSLQNTCNLVPESGPAVSIAHESAQKISVKPVPSDTNLPLLNEGPSSSQVAAESLCALSNTHESLENTCKVVPESEPAVSIAQESVQNMSAEPVTCHANLPLLNEGPSTSQQIALEREPAVINTHRMPEGSLCRVDTVIKGISASSQPSPELLKTVFSRCFSKDHFLNALVGHDVILEESSDREAS